MEDRASERACLALAVAGGAVVGSVDLIALELWPTVVAMLVFGSTLGFLRPRLAHVWATILGLAVPLAHVLAAVIGFKPPYAVLPNRWATLLALVPACLATVLGVAASWALGVWRRSAPRRGEGDAGHAGSGNGA